MPEHVSVILKNPERIPRLKGGYRPHLAPEKRASALSAEKRARAFYLKSFP